jgi:starvation-inducible outer membrane lipoprotein
MRPRHYLLAVALPFILAGCVTANQHVMESASAVELRSFQTRTFDMTDKQKMLSTVIATLQDLGFIIDKADEDLGLVTATKYSGYQIRMSVIVQPRGETQLAVRASALYNDKAIEEPMPYQDFFTALEKSLFLTAHQVD